MNITKAQSRLVDEVNKQAHIEESGYDYSNSVQGDIQTLVENNLEFEEQLRISSIIPRPGINNGITFTLADIEAYVAAHPQNSATSSDRIMIAEILAAGGTTNIPIQPNLVLPPVYSRFPSISTSPTHYIKNRGDVFSAPVDNSRVVHSDVEAGTGIVIIDDNLGVGAKYSFARDPSNLEKSPFYILKKDIDSVGQYREVSYKEVSKPIGGEAPPWTNLPVNEVQQFAQTAELQISVMLERVTLRQTDKSAALEEAFYLGMEKILEFKGKKNTKEYIKEQFVENSKEERPAQAVELYLDSRPGSKVKALVKVPTRNIPPLDDKEPEWKYKTEFKLEEFESMVSQLVEKILAFEGKIKEYDGDVSVFTPSIEVPKIKEMPGIIQFIADASDKYEGNILKDKGLLKMYWADSMKPIMIKFENISGKEITLANNFSVFPRRSAIKSRRTQHFIMNLDYIVENEMNTPWKEFLELWVKFRDVKIIPREKKKKDAESPEAEGPSVKTLEQLSKEDNFYNNTERRLEKYNERKGSSEYVGSEKLNPSNSSASFAISSKDMGELYNYFLNDLNITKMVLNSTKCMMPDLPLEALESIKKDFDLLENEYEETKNQYKEEGFKGLFGFLLPDELPTDDISDAFFKTLKAQTHSMLNQIISSLVGSLLSAFFDSCGKRDKRSDEGEQDKDAQDRNQLRGLLDNLQGKVQDLFESGEVSPEVFQSLMSDIAELLSLRELCDLLRGIPDRETLDIVGNLLDTSYCELKLDSDEEIISFFLATSVSMDLRICDELGDIIDNLPEDFLCPPDSSVRDSLLRGKGLTDKEIKEQLDRERDRNRKLTEQLLGSFEANELPNMFCSTDEEGNTIPGQIPFMDDQFEYTLETTLSSLFSGTYNSFTEEAMRYTQNLFMEVEVEERRFYNVFGHQVDENAEGEVYERNVFVTKRRPLPHLVDFYNEPELKSVDNYLEISVPVAAGSALEQAKSLFENNSALTEQMRTQMQALKDSLRGANEQASKVRITELDYCDILEKQEKSPDITPEEPTQRPEDEHTSQTMVENKCNPSELSLQPSSEETISLPPPPPPSVNQLAALEASDNCSETKIIGSSIKVNGKEYVSQREIPEQVISFVQQNVGESAKMNSENCVMALYRNYLNKVQELPRSDIESASSAFESEAPALTRLIRENLVKAVVNKIRGSKYLEYTTLGSDTDSPYERYILEYVNLGPQATPQCDPHLLRLSELVQDIKEDLQGELCIESGSKDSSELSPLESMMMKACIKATLRHYIIETLSTGILTTTLFSGRGQEITDLQISYIIEKIKEGLGAYEKPSQTSEGSCESDDSFSQFMPTYYEDFIEQLSIVTGMEKGENDNILRTAIRVEYAAISDGFLDSLLVSDSEGPRASSMVIAEIPRVKYYIFAGNVGFPNIPIPKPALMYQSNSSKLEGGNFVYYENATGDTWFSMIIPAEDSGAQLASSSNSYYFRSEDKNFHVLPLVQVTDLEMITVQLSIYHIFFPVDEYASALSIHEMEVASKMETTIASFGETRDNLFSLFYAIAPEKDDWKKVNKSLASMGGSSGFTKIFDFNNNLYDTPCTDLTFNFGSKGICWGNPFAGMGGFFAMALRMARDAALLEFKKYVERNDPAVKLGNRLSFLSKLACFNIPTSAIAGALNVGLPPWFPITPIAAAYHALGLGVFLPSALLDSDSEEGEKARLEIEGAGLKLPEACRKKFQTTLAIPASNPEEEDSQVTRGRIEREINSLREEMSLKEEEAEELNVEIRQLRFTLNRNAAQEISLERKEERLQEININISSLEAAIEDLEQELSSL